MASKASAAAGSAPAKSPAKKPTRKKAPAESRELAALVSAAAEEHKVLSPVLLNLAGLSQVTDFYYVASCESSRKVKAVAEKIVQKLKEFGVRALGVEGVAASDARWALLDFGDVIVHIFHPEARELYDLEGLWADAPRVDAASLVAQARGRSRGA
ncbi:MAG: ribosome silencing factor [Deltaproteobacteria bacterium]|jgi:ribosome-associated protein|nr:ribosome silencing factor [Deltaproteobacteria bacterium]